MKRKIAVVIVITLTLIMTLTTYAKASTNEIVCLGKQIDKLAEQEMELLDLIAGKNNAIFYNEGSMCILEISNWAPLVADKNKLNDKIKFLNASLSGYEEYNFGMCKHFEIFSEDIVHYNNLRKNIINVNKVIEIVDNKYNIGLDRLLVIPELDKTVYEDFDASLLKDLKAYAHYMGVKEFDENE